MRKLIAYGSGNLRTILSLDASGAILSVFLLGFVLPSYPHVFGVPVEMIEFLAIVPCVFLVFNLLVQRSQNIEPWALRAMANGHFMYALATFCLLMVNINLVTAFGLAYFIVQMCLTVTLALLEFRINLNVEKSRTDSQP